MSLHVLLLPTSYPRFYKPISGIFYQDQATALRNSGITVGVIDPAPRAVSTLAYRGLTSTRFQITTAREAGIQIVRAHDWCVPYARKLFARQFVWRARQLFDHYVRAFGRPDVIHAHEVLWGGVAARVVSQRARIPYVVTEHSGGYALDPLDLWKVPYLHAAMKDASVVMAVSGELSRRMQPFGDGRPLPVVPNVVDTEYFSPPAEPPERNHFLFMCIASQDMHKGIDVLLRGFQAAFSGNVRVTLEIGGEGVDRAKFEALAAGLGITGQVTWLGALSRDQVVACLRRADAFVMTSRYETFGVAYIEAMSTGLPVIATRCGGPDDFVDARCGTLVDVGRPDQVAEAMAETYRNRDRWRQRAPAIRRSVIDRFSEKVVAAQLIRIYEESDRDARTVARASSLT